MTLQNTLVSAVRGMLSLVIVSCFAISNVLILISMVIDFSISGITYIIPGPIVLLYLPKRKIIIRVYSVAALNPDRAQIATIINTTPITTLIVVVIIEIFIPPIIKV